MIKNHFELDIECSQHTTYAVDVTQPVEDLYEYTFTFTNERLQHFEPITIRWESPMKDAHYYWFPLNDRLRKLRADMHEGMPSKAILSAPVSIYYNSAGQNRLTCALSDPLNTVILSMGVREESAMITCKAELFTLPTKPQKTYEITLRIDCRDIPYYESLQDTSRWWANQPFLRPTHVPPSAKTPMYSTWYSFHQIMTDTAIEEQCRIAKSMGCEAVIVDDGWQTADNQRGYAYTGDWEVCEEKFTNMKEHVARIHAMDMKYILWYSVPYIGVKSKIWSTFKDKTLYLTEHNSSATLDPRYPDVREYIIGTYVDALTEWNIDGFKLDFVDRFDLSRCTILPEAKPGMDYISVQEAVDALLSSTIARLKEIDPDIMIEFRQKYVGPLMRKYGNIFRVGDCPGDIITNRGGICDIRLLSGNTVAHSDMVMWYEGDSVESAALQMTNIIFGVPQISMVLDQLPKDHYDMVTFWLDFGKRHRDILLDGHFEPLNPEQQYPLIRAYDSTKMIVGLYSDMIVKTDLSTETIVVNGKLTTELYMDIAHSYESVTLTIQDCMGQVHSTETKAITKGLHKFQIPENGVLTLSPYIFL